MIPSRSSKDLVPLMDAIELRSDARDSIANTLVVGLGSPHGDDRIGWMVLAKLRTLLPAAFRLNCLASPVDLLNHLNEIRLLHVVDACWVSACQASAAGSSPSQRRMIRIEWPCSEMSGYRWSSSHGMPLPAVLELASSLGVLPEKVVVWGVIGTQFGAGTEPSYFVSSCTDKWARQIRCELADSCSE